MTRPDRRTILIGTAGVLVLVLAAQLLPDSAPPVPSPPPEALAPPPAPPPVAVAPAAPAAPSVSPEGLRLFGVTGAGAIIGMPNGAQRLVTVGRDVMPGLTLRSVAIDHVILASSTGSYQLGFTGIAAAAVANAPAAPSNAPVLAAPDGAPARRNPLGGFIINDRQHDEASRQYVAGLRPRMVNGQPNGFVVQRGVDMPALRQAGLQPGDVLLTVNGEPVTDQEYLQNLSRIIAGTYTTRFEVERGGRRMTFALQVNPRPR